MEPLKKSFPSILGNIELVGDTGVWQISADTEELEAGLQLIHLKLTAPEAADLPHITLKWSFPQLDMQSRWHPACRRRYLPTESKAPERRIFRYDRKRFPRFASGVRIQLRSHSRLGVARLEFLNDRNIKIRSLKIEKG